MRMKEIILSVVLCGILFPSAAVAQQVIPSQLHAMPVQIKIPLPNGQTSFGTGLYMMVSNKVFLVTAGHCLFKSLDPNDKTLINSTANLLSYASNEYPRLKNFGTLDLSKLQKDQRIKRHPTHDVAVVQFGFESADLTSFADLPGVVFNQSGLIHNWSPAGCVLLTNVPDGVETLILGYPEELVKPDLAWLKSLLETDIDFDYPLIRRGMVSQKNTTKGKIIIDSGVYGGNSGGPVLIVQHPSPEVTTFGIAGIITKFVPTETRVAPAVGVTNSILVNSGYGVAEPIDFALELMRQF